MATFYPGGLFWTAVEETPGVRLHCLGKAGRWDLAAFLLRLVSFMRRLRPDVVHGYGVVANELAWLAGRAAGARVVWGLRASERELDQCHWTVRASLGVCGRLSPYVDLVIANSRAGMRYHVERGFRRGNLTVVPNGIDTDRFRPRPDARRRVRRRWAVDDSEFLFGLVGRVDPQKDHATFLEAMAGLARERAGVRVVCIGGSRTPAQRKLAGSPPARLLGERLRWEAAREDVERVIPALDALVLSSACGEGFPNVVGEAMAAEVPCIVTDVGDAAPIVGDPERTIPPRSARRLLAACRRLLETPAAERRRIGSADRRRVVESFGAGRLAERTSALLEAVARRSGPPFPPGDPHENDP